LAVHLEDLRSGEAAEERFPHLRGIHTRALGEQERLGDRPDRRCDDQLVAGLATWPAPDGPTCTIVLPRTSKIGIARTIASGSPPTMIESVPSIAPRSPPLTGASTIATSRAARAAAISRVGAGSIELMSITSDPAAAPSTTPLSPVRTCSTTRVSGSIVMVTSLAAATSAGPDARVAPASTTSSTGAGLREWTVRG